MLVHHILLLGHSHCNCRVLVAKLITFRILSAQTTLLCRPRFVLETSFKLFQLPLSTLNRGAGKNISSRINQQAHIQYIHYFCTIYRFTVIRLVSRTARFPPTLISLLSMHKVFVSLSRTCICFHCNSRSPSCKYSKFSSAVICRRCFHYQLHHNHHRHQWHRLVNLH